MCGYSLEGYASRKALEGEKLVLHKFDSGSKGLVAPSDRKVAVCIAPGTKLLLRNAPEKVRIALVMESDEAEAIFVQTKDDGHRDGIRVWNRQVLLQNLPTGLEFDVLTIGAELPISGAEGEGDFEVPLDFTPVDEGQPVPVEPELIGVSRR